MGGQWIKIRRLDCPEPPPPIRSSLSRGPALAAAPPTGLILEIHVVERRLARDRGGDADEAIAVLELRDDIQIVFTDTAMSGMNGLRSAVAMRGKWPANKNHHCPSRA